MALALAAIGGCGGSAEDPSRRPLGERPDKPPSRTQPLSGQAGRLVRGGPQAFRRELDALRGTPVVVNQWASWCGPCRYEMPMFARLARLYRGRVAFVGVNSQDGDRAARRFLRRYRTPFPHFFDPTTSIARLFDGGYAWPTTAYYSGDGKLVHTKPGSYATQAQIDRDIRRFALR